MYKTNVRALWIMTKTFHPLLEKTEGNVINIGSDVSIKANPDYFGYSDSKAAVVHMTRMMALQYAPKVRVNAVCPGDTFVKRWTSQEQLERRFGSELANDKSMREQLIEDMHHSIDIPMKRTGEVEDIAHAVSFLASDKASYITGIHLLVDGGASLI